MTSDSSIKNHGTPRLPYLPTLDGLRAIAVISVLFYHANLTWIPGGFLGVEMFFVISGYLITSLLLAEWQQYGSVDFKAFWLRRAKRLLPALFVLLGVVCSYTLFLLPDEVATLRGDAFSTAAYVNNWYQIFSHKSYFEAVGRPSLLRHMWSLAVEEQFYLVWPLLFTLMMRRFSKNQMLGIILTGAICSTLLMAWTFHPNTDPSRSYYGTDTRASGILLGVALAYLWPPGQPVDWIKTWVLNSIGIVGIGTLLVCFLVINEYQEFLYCGGFTLLGLATAELITAAVQPRAQILWKVFSWEPLRWVGLRSYGIYLWHFPIFMLTRPQLDVPFDGILLLAIRFILVLGVAELSYRFVELPIRQGWIEKAWNEMRHAIGDDQKLLKRLWIASSLSITAVVSIITVLMVKAGTPIPPEYLVLNKTNAAETISVKTNAPVVQTNIIQAKSLITNAPGSVIQTNLFPGLTAHNEEITAIGDSVMAGVVDEMKRVVSTNMVIDAHQGRQGHEIPGIIRKLHAQGKIKSTVILHIGNNGFFSAKSFDETMAELKDVRRVVVLNLKVPRRWESLNNNMLASSIKSYPNAILVDWQRLSNERPRLFWKDGIHLRPEGARFYANLIAQTLVAFKSG